MSSPLLVWNIRNPQYVVVVHYRYLIIRNTLQYQIMHLIILLSCIYGTSPSIPTMSRVLKPRPPHQKQTRLFKNPIFHNLRKNWYQYHRISESLFEEDWPSKWHSLVVLSFGAWPTHPVVRFRNPKRDTGCRDVDGPVDDGCWLATSVAAWLIDDSMIVIIERNDVKRDHR